MYIDLIELSLIFQILLKKASSFDKNRCRITGRVSRHIQYVVLMLSLYKRLGTEWNGIEWNTIAKVSVLSPNGGVTNRTETAVYACTSCSADTNLVS